MSIARRPKVLEDLIDLAYHLALTDLTISDRFLDACNDTFKRLEKMPRLGRVGKFRNPVLSDVRVWPVKGFKNHLIFYCITESGIEILRVLHSSRDLDRVFEEED